MTNPNQAYKIKSRNPPVSLSSQSIIYSLMPILIRNNLENLIDSCNEWVEILHWNARGAIIIKCEELVSSKDLHSKQGIDEGK